MENRLKELRLSKNRTQVEFARELNLPEATYISYEQRKRELPLDVAVSISKKYNVSLDWLYAQSTYKNELDSITKTLVALRKVFKVKYGQKTPNGHDTVLLVDYRFRDFINSMNTLLIEYSNHPKIFEKFYIEKLEEVYLEHEQYLSELLGSATFNEDRALAINELSNMDGFVLDNSFFLLLGLEDMNKKGDIDNEK